MGATDYAVIDPATGETLKTYDTISDDDLRAAIGRAADAHRAWGRETTVEQRAAVIASSVVQGGEPDATIVCQIVGEADTILQGPV